MTRSLLVRPTLATIDAAGHANMVQLVQLRWLAVAGQLATILLTQAFFQIHLPMVAMLGVLSGLVLLNAASLARLRSSGPITNGALFGALLLDVAALTAVVKGKLKAVGYYYMPFQITVVCPTCS